MWSNRESLKSTKVVIMVFKVLTIQGIWETLHPALCGDVVD